MHCTHFPRHHVMQISNPNAYRNAAEYLTIPLPNHNHNSILLPPLAQVQSIILEDPTSIILHLGRRRFVNVATEATKAASTRIATCETRHLLVLSGALHDSLLGAEIGSFVDGARQA